MVATTGVSVWTGVVSLTLLCVTLRHLWTVKTLTRKRDLAIWLMLVAVSGFLFATALWATVAMIATLP
jgi:hypothetical protein